MPNDLALARDVPPEPSQEDLAVVRPRRRRPLWAFGLAGAVGVAAIALLAGHRSGSVSWETATATRGDLALGVTAVGTIEPVQTVEVGSDHSGTLARVLVEQNARVRQGDVLAELDPGPFRSADEQARAALASAAASVDRAKVILADAEVQRDRTARLLDQKAAAQADLDTARVAADKARADVHVAEASWSQARATLDKAEQDLAETVIKAPIDGVVVHRYVEPGQTVVSAMQATPLFEVASDLAELTIEAGVDEADVGRVAVGQPATFTVSAWPDRKFTAVVTQVDVAPDPKATVVTYDAELRVDNAEGELRPGMTATAEIQVGDLPSVVRVPALALRYRPPSVKAAPSGTAVWVLEDGAPEAIPVRVLGTDGLEVAVDGVDEGVAVLVGGGR